MKQRLIASALFALLMTPTAHAQYLNPVTPLIDGKPASASNPVPVTGTFSATLAGFTPNGNYATLTSAGTSGSVALPAGTVVAFQNTGTTTVSCVLGVGSATATASKLQIPPSSTIFVTVGSNTFGACIDQTGSTSNTIVLAGGVGLGTNFGGGGGSGGGGGGAITMASGAVASGAYSSGAYASGSISAGAYAAGALAAGALATGSAVDGWDITQGTKADAAWTTGSGSVISLLKAIAGSEIATNRAVNVAQINGVTPLMGNGVTGTGSPRVTVASDNTPFTVKDTMASGAVASGAYSAGSYAAGALAAGAFASGAGVDGWDLTQGAKADSICGTATGTCSVVSLLKFLNNAATAALPAQSGFGVNIGAVQILDANSKAAVLDPCQTNLHSKALVNIVTATSTKIVTGTSSKKTYVCGMTVYPAGTTNFAIVEGSGTNCGTSALGLIGGNTAATGIIATAQAGFVSNGGGYSVMAATVNANDVCIITSAAVQLSGVVDYVQQ